MIMGNTQEKQLIIDSRNTIIKDVSSFIIHSSRMRMAPMSKEINIF